jgi:hypothetical protein
MVMEFQMPTGIANLLRELLVKWCSLDFRDRPSMATDLQLIFDNI